MPLLVRRAPERILNTTGTPHSFHVHDICFRILESGGEPPPPSLSGPKDTVYVPPGETMRLLTSFEDHAEPTSPTCSTATSSSTRTAA